MNICHVALARVAEDLLSRGDSPLAAGYLELLNLVSSSASPCPRLRQIVSDEIDRRSNTGEKENGSRYRQCGC
jgi:hypothetical protein